MVVRFTPQIKGSLVDTNKKNADDRNQSVTHTSLFLFFSSFLFPKYFQSNMFFWRHNTIVQGNAVM